MPCTFEIKPADAGRLSDVGANGINIMMIWQMVTSHKTIASIVDQFRKSFTLNRYKVVVSAAEDVLEMLKTNHEYLDVFNSLPIASRARHNKTLVVHFKLLVYFCRD